MDPDRSGSGSICNALIHILHTEAEEKEHYKGCAGVEQQERSPSGLVHIKLTYTFYEKYKQYDSID